MAYWCKICQLLQINEFSFQPKGNTRAKVLLILLTFFYRCDSIAKLKSKLQYLRSLLVDSGQFRKIYRYAFDFARVSSLQVSRNESKHSFLRKQDLVNTRFCLLSKYLNDINIDIEKRPARKESAEEVKLTCFHSKTNKAKPCFGNE